MKTPCPYPHGSLEALVWGQGYRASLCDHIRNLLDRLRAKEKAQ